MTALTTHLSIYDELRIFQIRSLAHIVQTSLRIDIKSLLIRRARRCTITTIFQHEDIGTIELLQIRSDGHAVANVACIAVEAQYRHGFSLRTIGRPDEQCIESFVVRRGDCKVFPVCHVEVREVAGFHESGSSVRRDVAWVDEFTAWVSLSE